MESPNIDTKALFAPKKGKQATKGQKQIYEGNQETLKRFTFVAIASILIKLIFLFYRSSTTYVAIFLVLFSIIVQGASIFGMRYMAKPVISGPSKNVVDGGIDLNLSGGFADKLKDIMITTSACSILSVFSEGFWALWLWLPGYFVYEVWVNVIAPWIFQPAPEENDEKSDKKKRKLERKMARAGYR